MMDIRAAPALFQIPRKKRCLPLLTIPRRAGVRVVHRCRFDPVRVHAVKVPPVGAVDLRRVVHPLRSVKVPGSGRSVPSVRCIGAAGLRRVCRVSPRIHPERPLCRLRAPVLRPSVCRLSEERPVPPHGPKGSHTGSCTRPLMRRGVTRTHRDGLQRLQGGTDLIGCGACLEETTQNFFLAPGVVQRFFVSDAMIRSACGTDSDSPL
jgi:hypothetical protein